MRKHAVLACFIFKISSTYNSSNFGVVHTELREVYIYFRLWKLGRFPQSWGIDRFFAAQNGGFAQGEGNFHRRGVLGCGKVFADAGPRA